MGTGLTVIAAALLLGLASYAIKRSAMPQGQRQRRRLVLLRPQLPRLNDIAVASSV